MSGQDEGEFRDENEVRQEDEVGSGEHDVSSPAPEVQLPRPGHCPGCGELLPELVQTRCPQCALPLTGPQAGALWQLDQWLLDALDRRGQLLATLRTQTSVPDPMAPGPDDPNSDPGRAPGTTTRTGGGGAVRPLLLGLGVLALVAASLVFLSVAWSAVGTTGRVGILAVITVTVLASAVPALRHGLHSTAEALSVLGLALLAGDLGAAHAFGLFGLDGVDGALFLALAACVVAAVGLAWSRVVTGCRSPAVIALFAAAVVPSAMVVAESLGDESWHLLLTVFLFWAGSPALASLRHLLPGPADRRHGAGLLVVVRITHLVLGQLCLVGAAVASSPHHLGYLLTQALFVAVLTLALFPPGTPLSRALGALVVPGAELGAAGRRAYCGGACAGLAVSAGLELHHGVTTQRATLVMLSVVGLAGVLLSSAVSTWPPARDRRPVLRARDAVVAMLVGALLVHTYSLLSDTDSIPAHDTRIRAGWVLLTLSGVAAHHALVRVAHRPVAVPLAALALVAGTAFALDGHDGIAAWALLLLGLTLAVPAGAELRRYTVPDLRPQYPLLVPAAVSLFTAFAHAQDLHLRSFGVAVPLPAVFLGLIGVLVLAVGAGLDRPLLDLGAVGLLGLANGITVHSHDVTTVEAYSLPLAGLLALAVLARRLPFRREVPSWVSLGPVLSSALLPTALFALRDGDLVRAAITVGAGALITIGGAVVRLQAPVVVGAATTVASVVTLLGAGAHWVPAWMSLASAGLVLLLAGITYEARIRDARRARRWLTALR